MGDPDFLCFRIIECMAYCGFYDVIECPVFSRYIGESLKELTHVFPYIVLVCSASQNAIEEGDCFGAADILVRAECTVAVTQNKAVSLSLIDIIIGPVTGRYITENGIQLLLRKSYGEWRRAGSHGGDASRSLDGRKDRRGG